MDREALALHRIEVLAHGYDRDETQVVVVDDRDALEVHVPPADGAQLADAQAGADGEADQVGEVGGDRDRVGVDVGEQAAAFLWCQAAGLDRGVTEGEGRASRAASASGGVCGGFDLLKRVAGQSDTALTCYWGCAVRDLNPEPAG